MPHVSSGSARIYYESHGQADAPALVFAHGRGGNAASWWQQVPRFARDYRVIVFDHRCFGRSDCPPEDFDRETFDADLLAILDAEGIARCGIVCQSMGGWTGLRMALHHPDRVACLVLSNTPGGLDLPSVRQALAEAREQFARHGVGQAAVAADFPRRAPEAAYLYAQIGGLNLRIPEALSHGGPGWIAPEALAGHAIPTLVVTSAHDQLFPPAMMRDVADAIPGATLVTLPTAGHSPYFETPDAFNDAIGSFLREYLV